IFTMGGNVIRVNAIQTRITFWDYYTNESAAINEGIAAFEAANPDIKVERKQRDVFQQIWMLDHVGYGAETAPDVFVVPLEKEQAFTRIVGNSALAAWSDFPDFEAFKATFPFQYAVFAEGYNVFGGKTYSAPLNMPVPTLYLYVNADLY